MAHLVFKSDLTVMNIIQHVLIWILLGICTLGIALLLYPFYMARFIINKTYVVDKSGQKRHQLVCTLTFTKVLMHAFIWLLLSIVTLGLAYIVYAYKIFTFCFQHTELIDLKPSPKLI